MGIEVGSTDKRIDICKKIKESPDFEKEFVRGCLEDIIQQRKAAELKAHAETTELKAQAEAIELKVQGEAEVQAPREEREFELEKIRLSNAPEIDSVGSA
ncbi:hypothetical protein AVEN_202153-1 [Araneus ventricosus]|uniref:Uncharacterized protein n=1 Tax=Araneus ventricosus TaxID=182803 RepID=A0A4Y2E172_ARAVE|nr:hypothetical protein AVEN_202153-1 [Araneus ventricosus]